jgi:sigma-B regulation protein RsbU (phosphoserine phosphatase)
LAARRCERGDSMGKEQARLVVIHRDGDRRESLSRLLQEQGYAVYASEAGCGASDAALTQGADLVLLDLSCAPLSGPAPSAHRPHLPTRYGAPVIVVGSVGTQPGLARSLAMGADDYVEEPSDDAVLPLRVERSLERQRLRQEGKALSNKLEKLTRDLTKVILPVGIALSAVKDLDRLLEKIVLEAKSLCNADGGTLYLRTKDDRLKFAIMHTDCLGIAMGGTTGVEIPHPPLSMYDPSTGEPNHHNVATHVALQGEPVNIADVYHAEGFDFSATKRFDEKNGYRTISCLTVPLKDHESKVIGVLQVLNAQDPVTDAVIPFDPYLELVTESLSSQAAVALNNHLLMDRERELTRFERDVQIGRKMQADFLPAELPGLSDWELAAYFQPAREVSGDFYDAFTVRNGSRVALVIADVCDKGVGAALFMTLIRSLIRAFAEQRYAALSQTQAGPEGDDPMAVDALALAGAVTATNDYISTNHSRMNMFATMFFGVLDPGSGWLVYVNGGHEAPAIVGSDGLRTRLTSNGPAVGMLPGVDFQVQRARLEPGELLLAYTDGVTEARAPDRSFFSERRLLSVLEQGRGRPAQEVVDELVQHLRDHIATADQFDDITILAAKRC